MTENTFKIPLESAGEKKPSRLIPKACFTTEDNDETTLSFYEAEDGSVATGVWECPPHGVHLVRAAADRDVLHGELARARVERLVGGLDAVQVRAARGGDAWARHVLAPGVRAHAGRIAPNAGRLAPCFSTLA